MQFRVGLYFCATGNSPPRRAGVQFASDATQSDNYPEARRALGLPPKGTSLMYASVCLSLSIPLSVRITLSRREQERDRKRETERQREIQRERDRERESKSTLHAIGLMTVTVKL